MAQAIPLPIVLQAIGKQVGFEVEDRGSPGRSVTISARATLNEILQRLLRGENHAIVYRTVGVAMGPGGGEIAKIVLMSQPLVGAVRQEVEAPGSEAPSPSPQQADLSRFMQALVAVHAAPAGAVGAESTAPRHFVKPETSAGVGFEGSSAGLMSGSSLPPRGVPMEPPPPAAEMAAGNQAFLGALGKAESAPSSPDGSKTPGVPLALQEQAMGRVQALADALERAQLDLDAKRRAR
jgi:hypothetical protein